MNRMTRAALLAATILTPGAAFAQDGDAATAQEGLDDRKPEIVVTARKTEESIQDVPIAVSAFSAEQLAEQGISNIDDLSRRTSGFVFDTPFGRQFDRPIIRGQANILGSSGVSVFIDNVNVTQSIRSLNFGDIESIEIIKGPQSALFGRNTYSGAINITTRQPTNDFSGEVSFEIGEDELYELNANIRGPIVEDKLYFSLAGRYYDFESEFDRPGNLNPSLGNESSKSIGATLEFRPTDGWTSKLRVAYNEDDDGHFPIGLFGFPNLNANVPGGTQLGGNQPFYIGVVPTQGSNPSGAPQLPNIIGEGGGLEREEWFFSLNNELELGDYTLVSTLGYTRERFRDLIDSDGQPGSYGTARIFGPIPLGPVGQGFGLIPFDFTTNDNDLQQTYVAELRLDSPQSQPFRWRVGGYYFRNEETDDTLREFYSPARAAAIRASRDATIAQIVAAQPGIFFVSNFTDSEFTDAALGPPDVEQSTIENFSIFGSVSYDLTDAVTATAELRWATEDQRLQVFDVNGGGLVALAGTPAGLFDVQAEFNAVTPRFILDWEAGDNTLVYASAAKGTKPGGFNGAQGFQFGFGTFDEESVWQFELGAKNQFFDRQLTLNIAGFFSDLSDYQLTQNLAALGANTTTGSVTANLGDVEIYGIELDAVFAPRGLPGLTMGGTYAWTDASFTSGNEATQGAVFGNDDLTGQTLPRQARHQASFFADYEAVMSDDFTTTFSVNGNYLSSRFAQVQNLAETGASFELDARITFDYRDRLSLTFYGKNLTNEDAALGVLRFIDPTGGNGSFVVNGVTIANGFNLASAGQSRGFQYNNRPSRRFGAIARLKF